MTASETDLDDVQNKAMHPVFQQTLLTPETSAIVLELEKAEEKSRKILHWSTVLQPRTSCEQEAAKRLGVDYTSYRYSVLDALMHYIKFLRILKLNNV